MHTNNAIKKTQLGADSKEDQSPTASIINLQGQQVDVARLKPEARSRLIGILSSHYEKNTSRIQEKNKPVEENSRSDFDELLSLVREELDPQSMSEKGKTQFIYLLHSKVEQQYKELEKGATAAVAVQSVPDSEKHNASASVDIKSTTPDQTLPSAKSTITDKPEQPFDSSTMPDQGEHTPEINTSVLGRVLSGFKQVTGFIKPSTSTPVIYPEVEYLNIPSQGMPKYDPIDEDDEDDEDDEIDNERLFELKGHFKAHSQTKWPTERRDRVVEVMHLNQNEVKDVTYLEKGQSYKIKQQGKSVTLAKNKGNNHCFYIFNGTCFNGEVRLRTPDGKLSVSELSNTSTGLFSGSGAQSEIPDHADICMRAGLDTYVIRSKFPIKAPEVKIEEKNYRTLYQSFAGSAGFHLLVLIIAGSVIHFTAKEPKPKEPEFVKIEIPNIEKNKKVEKPKPKVVKPKPKPVAKKVKPKPKPKAKPQSKPKPKPLAKPKAGGGNKGNIKKRDVKKSGLLASLGSKSGKSKPKRNLASVTNLDAASSSSSSAKLKVSGLKAKLGNSRMSLPTGELISSKGAADVLRSGGVSGKGSVAALARGGTGAKNVNAMVTAKMSKRVKIKGGLSRDQVKRVIDANMDDVTYCYETALMSTSGLAGKVVFEWKVLTSGKVGAVNIQSSTVKSDEIHSCIKSAIKTWKFPQPSGGEAVFVSYPFIFDTVGF